MKRYIWLILAVLLFGSCDDNTGTLGLIDDNDLISSSYATFEMRSTTVKADSILSNTSSGLLGLVTDTETGSKIRADFLAQFHTMENYSLPSYDKIAKDAQGRVIADSITVRLYFQDFYGDSTNVMKMDVYELDTLNVIEENKKYYSNTDLSQFINAKRQKPLVSKVYTARDMMLQDGQLDDNDHYHNVCVTLPREYGSFILNKYYENPDFFKSSYDFIRHVCPGFYFKTTNGDGTMLYLDVSSLDIFFTYKGKNPDTQKDTVMTGMTRFAATGEVIQSTQISYEGTEQLINRVKNTDSTLLKTPAGLYTELELPVNDIYKEHQNDSVSQVKVTMNRYNNFNNSIYGGAVPQTLLMVRKSEMYRFFEEKKNADGITSFAAAHLNNQYPFGNISRLVSHCMNEKREGMKKEQCTEAEWEKRHPDWNKVVLIPIQVIKNQSNVITYTTIDLRISSARLAGENTTTPVYVIYSKFAR